MMEYIILILLTAIVVFGFFIYKKLDQNKNNNDMSNNYAVLNDKFDTLTKKTDALKDDINKSQITLSDKLINQQNTTEKEIKSDLSKFNESLAKIVTTQKELSDLKISVIDFKNLFNNQTTRGRLGNDSLKVIVEDVLHKRYFLSVSSIISFKKANTAFLYNSRFKK